MELVFSFTHDTALAPQLWGSQLHSNICLRNVDLVETWDGIKMDQAMSNWRREATNSANTQWSNQNSTRLRQPFATNRFTWFHNHVSIDLEQLSSASRAKRHASQGSQRLLSCCSSWESFAHLPGQTGDFEPIWIWNCSKLPFTSFYILATLPKYIESDSNPIPWVDLFNVATRVRPLEALPGTLWPVKSCLGDKAAKYRFRWRDTEGMLTGLHAPKSSKWLNIDEYRWIS